MIVSRSMAEFLLGKDLPKPKGGGRSYFLLSKKTPHRNLGGPYKTKEEALERERQVQYFKRRGNPSSFHERDHDWDQPLALDGTTRNQIVRHYEKYGRNMLPYLKGHDVLVVIALTALPGFVGPADHKAAPGDDEIATDASPGLRFAAGYALTLAVTMALYHRDASEDGRGQVIDLALYEPLLRASEASAASVVR